MSPKPIIRLMLICLLIAIASVVYAGNHDSDDVSLVSYQGKLVQGGVLVSGDVDIFFGIYDSGTNGTCLYGESNIVTVVDGYYSTVIGKNPSWGQLKQILKQAGLYLEVTIDGEILSPREQFTPPPYAKSSDESWRAFVSSSQIGYRRPEGQAPPGPTEAYNGETVGGWATVFAANGLQYAVTFDDRPPMETIGEDGDHSYLIFPPVGESREIAEVRCILSGFRTELSPLTNYPSLTVEITGYTGTVKRLISTPLVVPEMTVGVWTNAPLLGSRTDRTIGTDELLLIHYNPGLQNGGYWQHTMMFDVRVK